jgi:hypothetical protein
VNGSEEKIEIFKPFEESFTLTKKILFQPFDISKWFVIGFAAWLANLGSGNYNFNWRGNDWKDSPAFQSVSEWFSEIPRWVLFGGIAAIIILLLSIMIVLAWLRARGRFMFIDCIVNNRGAIAGPWREFREQGNSYFLLSLIVGIVTALILAIAGLPFIVPLLKRGTFQHANVYFICTIAFWLVILVTVVLAWAMIAHFMVAIMYRRRCLAREGFRTAVSLIANYPGEITLYCLFWIVLGIGTAIASCLLVLATCCIALLPYIGTVILLPLYVCLRTFGLRFIRQFGPDYDVWAAVPETAPVAPTVPPPLPS